MRKSGRTATDAPVGLLALCRMLISLLRPRDEGVPRRPGGLAHKLGSIPVIRKTPPTDPSARRAASRPMERHAVPRAERREPLFVTPRGPGVPPATPAPD